MDYVVNIVVVECEDVFEVAQLLEPIAKIDKLKMVSVMPRPVAPQVGGAGMLPGPPQGSPGRQSGIGVPQFSISEQPKQNPSSG